MKGGSPGEVSYSGVVYDFFGLVYMVILHFGTQRGVR